MLTSSIRGLFDGHILPCQLEWDSVTSISVATVTVFLVTDPDSIQAVGYCCDFTRIYWPLIPPLDILSLLWLWINQVNWHWRPLKGGQSPRKLCFPSSQEAVLSCRQVPVHITSVSIGVSPNFEVLTITKVSINIGERYGLSHNILLHVHGNIEFKTWSHL